MEMRIRGASLAVEDRNSVDIDGAIMDAVFHRDLDVPQSIALFA
jgi:hypothetical protein